MSNDSNGDFPVEPHLTSIAVAYRNPDKVLIADQVLPRDDSLQETIFSYHRAKDIHQAFTLPDTTVGPRGRVARLEVEMEEVQASTSDNALDIPLSAYDLKRKGAKERATEVATSLIQLRHEKRVADVVFDPAIYPTSQKVELTGTDRLDHASYVGNPLKLINDARRAMLLKGNIMVLGDDAFSVLRMNPHVVKAVHGNDGSSGMASAEQLATLLGFQQVLVGEGWLNVAKPGESPDMQLVWGPHISIIHRDRSASTQGGVTFGLTAQYRARVAGSIPDCDVGMRGGERIRVGESTKPIVVAGYGGYLIENAVGTA